MKTSRFFPSSMMMASLLLAGFLTFNACKDDDDPAPTAKDVVNTAAASEMKTTVAQATTLTALPAEFKADAVAVTALVSPAKAETIAAVDLAPVVSTMKSDNGLSSDEVTKLKANDLATYNAVVARLSKLPSFISQADIDAAIAGMKANAALSGNLVKVVGSADKMYSDDYYAGALALIQYRNDYTIPVLEKLIAMKASGLKSASTVQDAADLSELIRIYVGIIINTYANQRTYTFTFTVYISNLHSGGTTN